MTDKASELIKLDEKFVGVAEVVKPNDKVNPLFGMFTYTITLEQLEALKNGDVIYLNIDGEYSVLVYVKGE